jgi:hypothetical protein
MEPDIEILKFFKYEHLPQHLQEVSRDFCVLAKDIDEKYPDSAEKSAGLRKLLESKDCIEQQ